MNQQIPAGEHAPYSQSQAVAIPAGARDPDEINLLEYAYVLVKNKWWIIGATVLGVFIGLVVAYHKGPRYVAEAVIAPKESESKTVNLAGLGAFGGLVSSQLGLGGNASLDKIELILTSREFSAALLDRYSLLPEIYRWVRPSTYKKEWRPGEGKWLPDFAVPKRLDMGALVKKEFLKYVNNRNNTMTLTIQSKDSTFSEQLLQHYLDYLNDYLRSMVEKDAQENVAYLNKQLEIVSDPLLREKLQELISTELEKAMLVSHEAFRVVDPVYRTRQFKEKKLYPLVFGAAFFFLSIFVTILFHALASAPKTSYEVELISKIRRSLFLK